MTRVLFICEGDAVVALRRRELPRQTDSSLTILEPLRELDGSPKPATILPPRRVIPSRWYPNRAARRAAGYVRGRSSPGDTVVYREID